MRINLHILSLPAALILLVTSCANAAPDNKRSPLQWPDELVPHSPEDSRSLAGQTSLVRNPIGVMKMSDDPGEKFYMHYWQYEEDLEQSSIPEFQLGHPLRSRDEEEDAKLLANASAAVSYKPAFALHADDGSSYQDLKARGAVAALAALEKRQFACPTGTSDCSSIGAPYACCPTGEQCYNVTDTGYGSVGCCPDGATCGGSITSCGGSNTPCLANTGGNYQPGGCCIPNYVCAGLGCVINPTLVVTVVVTQTFTATGSQSSTVTTSTSTVVSTITPSTTTQTYTGLQTTLACSTGSQACPVNLGGGCCENGYTCASMSSCIPPSGSSVSSASTSVTGILPLRPNPTDSSTTSTTTAIAATCPTGFYACSAYYRGGCCQTGRNCDTTSCPPTSSTTIISGTATIVVPVGPAATVATPSGACATGWSTCAASVGGNCCPSGWQCGTASCTSISPTQTDLLQKGSPSSGTTHIWKRGRLYALGEGLLLVFVLI